MQGCRVVHCRHVFIGAACNTLNLLKFALETYGMLPHERMDADLWRITADRQRTDSRMLTSVPPVS